MSASRASPPSWLGLILLVTGVGIGWVGLEKILAGNYESLPIPGMIALVAAIVSIAVKEGMFWYTRHWARVIRSSAFEADAWHHRSDAMSSIGALVGVGGSMLGYPVLDPIASVVICLFILKQGISIIYDALKKMLDTSCGEQFEKEVRQLVDAENQVERIDMLRTRMFRGQGLHRHGNRNRRLDAADGRPRHRRTRP